MTLSRRTAPVADGAKGLTLGQLRDFVAESASAPDDTDVRAGVTIGGRLRWAEVTYDDRWAGRTLPPDPQRPTSP